MTKTQHDSDNWPSSRAASSLPHGPPAAIYQLTRGRRRRGAFQLDLRMQEPLHRVAAIRHHRRREREVRERE
ncbi:hypothetical protein MHYP_G00138710 [Metynnis hypsauchen]